MLAKTPAWRFRCYLKQSGADLIQEWHGQLSKKGQAHLERTLEHLCVLDQTEWQRPHASALGHHIYVIRFRDENRTQHRIFGHFQGDEFVMTTTAIEKDNRYEPNNAKEIAYIRRQECLANPDQRTQECFRLDRHWIEDAEIDT
jgi:hypothetical protein